MNKSRAVDVLKELKSHLQKKYRMLTINKAFTAWYIESRFGELPGIHKLITDQGKDGGIDAIINTSNTTYIFQMKYEEVIKLRNLSRADVRDFDGVASIFQSNDKEKFLKWLSTVKESLHSVYKDIFKKINEEKRKAKFILVTTKRDALDVEVPSIEIEDSKRILPLWDYYQEGYTPPAEILTFEMVDKLCYVDPDKGLITYVGLASLKDFRRAMEDDKNERLFAANVRTDLKTKINRDITKTYEEDPNNFWLYNNGLYIICSDVKVSGNEMTLYHPSIINGSQSLHSIKRAQHNNDGRILARVLKLDISDRHKGRRKLLSDIIKRTNKNNKMNEWNLIGQDPRQLYVARYLANNLNIYYERREKEWTNEKSGYLDDMLVVRSKDLAQWLSMTRSDVGIGRARSSLADLLESPYYERLFGSYDRELSSHQFSKLGCVIWSGLFASNVKKYLPNPLKSPTEISRLFVGKFIYEALSSVEVAGDIDQKLQKKELGKRNVPRKIITELSLLVREIIWNQKKYQIAYPNIDFTNYMKRDDLINELYKKIIKPLRLKKIGSLFKQFLDDIY